MTFYSPEGLDQVNRELFEHGETYYKRKHLHSYLVWLHYPSGKGSNCMKDDPIGGTRKLSKNRGSPNHKCSGKINRR